MADDDNTESKMVPDKPLLASEFKDYLESLLDLCEQDDFNASETPSLTFDEWMERITEAHHAVD